MANSEQQNGRSGAAQNSVKPEAENSPVPSCLTVGTILFGAEKGYFVLHPLANLLH